MNVNTLYLAVFILLEQKFPMESGALIKTILRGGKSSTELTLQLNLRFNLSIKLWESISVGGCSSIAAYVGLHSPNKGTSVYKSRAL